MSVLTDLEQSTGIFNWTFNQDGTKKSADDAALKNASAAANSGTETATIVLRGYPLLKGKSTLEITGVGKGSGKWYCKTVIQEWNVTHGYITQAQLTKGKGGEGGDGDGNGNDGGNGPVAPKPKVN